MSSEYPSLFESCQPRDDVLDGSLQEEQFAAKLSTVVHNPEKAAPVYRDPDSFYDMTYPTEGLRTLLSNLTGRFLATTEYDPGSYTSSILCLDTRFGGGKTHDLIGSYHLSENPVDIDNLSHYLLDGDEELAADYQNAVAEGLDIATGVFIGTKADSKDARHADDDPNAPNTQTMWGELAYQLYGLDGYEYLYVFSPRAISVVSHGARTSDAVDRCKRRTSSSSRDGLRPGDHPVSSGYDFLRAKQRRDTRPPCCA